MSEEWKRHNAVGEVLSSFREYKIEYKHLLLVIRVKWFDSEWQMKLLDTRFSKPEKKTKPDINNWRWETAKLRPLHLNASFKNNNLLITKIRCENY